MVLWYHVTLVCLVLHAQFRSGDNCGYQQLASKERKIRRSVGRGWFCRNCFRTCSRNRGQIVSSLVTIERDIKHAITTNNIALCRINFDKSSKLEVFGRHPSPNNLYDASRYKVIMLWKRTNFD